MVHWVGDVPGPLPSPRPSLLHLLPHRLPCPPPARLVQSRTPSSGPSWPPSSLARSTCFSRAPAPSTTRRVRCGAGWGGGWVVGVLSPARCLGGPSFHSWFPRHLCPLLPLRPPTSPLPLPCSTPPHVGVPAHLSELLARVDGAKALAIIQHMAKDLVPIMEKGLVDCPLVHRCGAGPWGMVLTSCDVLALLHVGVHGRTGLFNFQSAPVVLIDSTPRPRPPSLPSFTGWWPSTWRTRPPPWWRTRPRP